MEGSLAMESTVSYVVKDVPCRRIYLNKLSGVILSTILLNQMMFLQASLFIFN